MLLKPPDPKICPPSELFAAFLDPRPRRALPVEISGVGRFELFVPVLSSRRWVEIHRRLAAAYERKDPRADAEYLAGLLVDSDGEPALSADSILDLYEHEIAALSGDAARALATISPTQANADGRLWIAVLVEGAKAPENLQDALSLGGCCDVSWGYGAGAVHVRDEPEVFYGLPRRELLDCHWFAYHAARRLRNELTRG